MVKQNFRSNSFQYVSYQEHIISYIYAPGLTEEQV